MLRFSKHCLIDVRSEVIPFIGVSYDDLNSMPIIQLKEIITKNMVPYFEKISQMDLDEKIKMLEDIKETRKANFRFSQDITRDIQKDRIQIALAQLARLFRRLNEEIKEGGNA
jgi:hypothetical protein